jgi:hypothetical protein
MLFFNMVCLTEASPKVEPNVFIVLSIVPVFALFFLGVPIYDSILRCVNADVKSIAVGMKVGRVGRLHKHF